MDPCAFPGEGDVLAREPRAEEVERFIKVGPPDLMDVAQVGHLGPVVLQHGAGVRLDLGEERLLDAQPTARQREPADAGAEIPRDEGHPIPAKVT